MDLFLSVITPIIVSTMRLCQNSNPFTTFIVLKSLQNVFYYWPSSSLFNFTLYITINDY